MDRRRLMWIEGALWRWMDLARRRPWWTLSLWAMTAAACLLIAQNRLSVNTDASDLLAADLPYQQAKRAYEAVFPNANGQVLVLVRAATPDGALIAASDLAARLSARPDAVEAVFAPFAADHFQRNGLLYMAEDELERLMGRLSRAAPLIERLAAEPALSSLWDVLADGAENIDDFADVLDRDSLERIYIAVAHTMNARLAPNDDAPASPLAWSNLFVDEPGANQRILTLTPVLDYSRLRPTDPVVAAIESEARAMRAETGVAAEVLISGEPVLRSDELRSVSQGVGAAFAVSLVLVTMLLLWAYRSWAMAAATIAVVLIAIIMTAAFAALVVGPLNLIAIAFAVLMVGLGVDFAVHLGLHMIADRRRGVAAAATIYRSARDIGAPLALAAPTTALAFLAFTPTAFHGMAQLGIIGAAGVLIAFLTATSVLPAALAIAPQRRRTIAARAPQATPRAPVRPTPWRDAAAWMVVGLAFPAAALAPFAQFDADPMGLRDPDAASVRAFHAMAADPDTTPYRLNLLAPSLSEAAERAAKLETLSVVDEAITLRDFAPADQDVKLELIDAASVGLEFALHPLGPPTGDPDAPAPLQRLQAALITDDSMAARGFAAALARYAAAPADLQTAVAEDIFRYWPAQLERMRRQLAAAPVTLDALPADIIARYQTPDGRARIEITPAMATDTAADRRAFVEAVLAVEPTTTGPARSVLGAGDAVTVAMLQASLTAAVLVAALLWWVLKDLRLTAFIMTPLVLAATLTTATGVLFDMPFNFANAIVIPLLVGLGVDSGVHLAMRANAVGGGASVHQTTTPRAVIFSALTTIASFATLAFSPHRGTASMGALLTVAIGWTLVCTVFVLPVLMDALRRRAARRTGAHATARAAAPVQP